MELRGGRLPYSTLSQRSVMQMVGTTRMDDLSITEIHQLCLSMVNQIIQRLGWRNLLVDQLYDRQKRQLARGIANSVLNWEWAMNRYRNNFIDSVPGLSIRINDFENHDPLHAVILYKYDSRRKQFCICMLENFIQHKDNALSGKILIIALIYSTSFCEILGLEDIYIQDPTPKARPLYSSFSFAPVWHDQDKMSANVTEVLQLLRACSITLGLII